MHRTTFRSIAVLAAFVFAALAFAQSADKNTAGPTGNQLQLRLTEPAEGSTITGNQVRVTVAYNQVVFGQGQGTKFGEPNFPHPIFDVFLDNDLKATLKGGESNVATIDNVPPGNHKVVVMAKNISGELIDRKEVGFTSVPAVAAEVAPAPAPPPPAAPIEQPETVTSAPPPPPPAAPAPAEMTQDELPATGSSHPRAAVLGLVLICAGLLFARKAR